MLKTALDRGKGLWYKVVMMAITLGIECSKTRWLIPEKVWLPAVGFFIGIIQ